MPTWGSHDWFYYKPLEREICLSCGRYRSDVEAKTCRQTPYSGRAPRGYPTMADLLQNLRAARDLEQQKRTENEQAVRKSGGNQ